MWGGCAPLCCAPGAPHPAQRRQGKGGLQQVEHPRNTRSALKGAGAGEINDHGRVAQPTTRSR